MAKKTGIGPDVTNGGEGAILSGVPYRAKVRIQGVADLLFHKWDPEAVEAKAKSAKGSVAKKTDDIKTYVYRNDDNKLCIPGENLRRAVVQAAKFRQDPRSPRKSAMELTQAGVISLTMMGDLGVKDWDYEHKCRVQVQRGGLTRVRPAIKAGWAAEFIFLVTLPEYISPDMLHGLVSDAGRLVGVLDFRPTYGRFSVTKFDVLANN